MADAPEIPLEWIPRLPRRYAATVVDTLLVIVLLVVPSSVAPADDAIAQFSRFGVALVGLFVYDPVCTGRFVTLGQWVARVRVRRFDNGEKIGVARAYGRILVKVLLGFISFLALPFNPGRRAIHDLASGSIVIMAPAERDFELWARSHDDETEPVDGPANEVIP